MLRSDLDRDVKNLGYVKIERSPVSESQSRQIYDLFDRLIHLLDRDNYSGIDSVIDEFINGHESPIVDETTKIKEIRKKFGDYVIYAHQHFMGSRDFLFSHISNQTELHDLWDVMEVAHTALCDAFLPLLVSPYSATDFTTILKVWRYTAKDGKKYLIPPHYDRTIMTVVVNTKNIDETECLMVGPYGDGQPLNREINDMDYSDFYVPIGDDFPIAFPGLFAKHYLNLNPTLHAVRQSSGMAEGQNRYSLVFFIVPNVIPLNTSGYVFAE